MQKVLHLRNPLIMLVICLKKKESHHGRLHHLASRLLSIMTGNNIITQEVMIDLWLFMIQAPLFTKVSKACDLLSINFVELNLLLKRSAEHVYFSYLVGISARIEENVKTKGLYTANIYNQTAAKEIALKI